MMPRDATAATVRAKVKDSDTSLVDVSLRLEWLGPMNVLLYGDEKSKS